MPRNVSVINETETTVSITASLARRLDSANSLPVTAWRIQYERQSTDGDMFVAIFNTSTSRPPSLGHFVSCAVKAKFHYAIEVADLVVDLVADLICDMVVDLLARASSLLAS